MNSAININDALSTIRDFAREVPRCEQAQRAARCAGLSVSATNPHAHRIFSRKACALVRDLLTMLDPADPFALPLKEAHLAFDLRAAGVA